MTEDGTVTRDGYVYGISQGTPPVLIKLSFHSSPAVNVLIDDPGLSAIRKNDRVIFSAPIENPPKVALVITVRRIIRVDRWEPVWTLIDTERRRAWNQSGR